MQLKHWQQVKDTLPASLTEGSFRPFWEQTASLHRPARPFDDLGVVLVEKPQPFPVLMCVKLSGNKAASSNVFLVSVGARHDEK